MQVFIECNVFHDKTKSHYVAIYDDTGKLLLTFLCKGKKEASRLYKSIKTNTFGFF